VVDLRTPLQIMRNYEQGLHKPSTSTPPPRRPTEPAPKARWYPKELQPPLLPPLFPPHRFTLRKHLPLQPLRQERPQALASLMECRWDLRNFRIPRLVPRGAASKDFGDSLKAILALAERYPAQSLPLYILRVFAQFLPALLMPCSRRGKPRSMRVAFRKGNGSPFGIRPSNTTTAS